MEKSLINTKQIGLNIELHCISYFSDCGFLVSVPYGDNGRYDLVVDVNNHLLRVQVKSASLTYDNFGNADGIKFFGTSNRINTRQSYTRKYTEDEIDYFATYWNNRVYVIPVNEVSTEKKIRFYSTQNGQDDYVSFLEDYTIIKQWSKFCNELEEPSIDNIAYHKNNGILDKVTICQRCGKPISHSFNNHCFDCAAYLQRRVERPSKEKLKNLIRNISFTEIGKQYGVSDKSISKWCKYYHLPSTKKEIKQFSDEEWAIV